MGKGLGAVAWLEVMHEMRLQSLMLLRRWLGAYWGRVLKPSWTLPQVRVLPCPW